MIFYKDEHGASPAYEAFREILARGERKAVAKCQVRIQRLAEKGYELRRPESDYLRDDIRELRARQGSVNYRILYFFHGGTAVLSHVVTKEGRLPDMEIDRAILHKRSFSSDIEKHTLQS